MPVICSAFTALLMTWIHLEKREEFIFYGIASDSM